jgi:hypothetical protein
VAAARERGQVGEGVGEPGRLVGQMDKAVLDRRRLGVEAHDLVAVRRMARHMRKAGVDQVLSAGNVVRIFSMLRLCGGFSCQKQEPSLYCNRDE